MSNFSLFLSGDDQKISGVQGPDVARSIQCAQCKQIFYEFAYDINSQIWTPLAANFLDVCGHRLVH